MGDLLKATFVLLISIVSVIYSETPTNQQQVANSNNAFTVVLYKKLLKANENLICSPFSVSTVLSMLWSGADGDTATEIQKTLVYESLTQDKVDNGYKTLLPLLKSTSEYNLSVADAIFLIPGFEALPKFIDSVKTNYYADVLPLLSADSVNTWAKNKTNNLIPKILDTLDDNTLMILANAVYFKGSWHTKFEKSLTLTKNFKNNDLVDKNTNLMNLKANFPYSESTELNAQVLHLPYEGLDMFMIVFLPKSGSTLDDLEKKLTESTLKAAIGRNAKNQTVIVTLPRFDVESSFDLNKPLQSLGMQKAFTNSANFSKLSQSNKVIKVSKVLQKAIIKVNEEGTEAAAVTVIGVMTTSINTNPPQPVVFNADHPFLYVLYHKPTDTNLFIGRYTKV